MVQKRIGSYLAQTVCVSSRPADRHYAPPNLTNFSANYTVCPLKHISKNPWPQITKSLLLMQSCQLPKNVSPFSGMAPKDRTDLHIIILCTGEHKIQVKKWLLYVCSHFTMFVLNEEIASNSKAWYPFYQYNTSRLFSSHNWNMIKWFWWWLKV